MSDNNSIPEAAVEAAAKVLWQTDQHDDSWAGEFPEYMDYLRAEAIKALEAAAPHMLAQVTTLEDLDALPRFSVIRSDEGCVFERQTMWHEAGSRDLMYSLDITLPATVLQLGWGEE